MYIIIFQSYLDVINDADVINLWRTSSQRVRLNTDTFPPFEEDWGAPKVWF
jgi:hypothetical protein